VSFVSCAAQESGGRPQWPTWWCAPCGPRWVGPPSRAGEFPGHVGVPRHAPARQQTGGLGTTPFEVQRVTSLQTLSLFRVELDGNATTLFRTSRRGSISKHLLAGNDVVVRITHVQNTLREGIPSQVGRMANASWMILDAAGKTNRRTGRSGTLPTQTGELAQRERVDWCAWSGPTRSKGSIFFLRSWGVASRKPYRRVFGSPFSSHPIDVTGGPIPTELGNLTRRTP
jgi:hypothetical protein